MTIGTATAGWQREAPARRRRPGFWSRLLRNRLALSGAVIIAGLLLVAALAPVLAPHGPLAQNLDARLVPGVWAGNIAYPLGTDELGRDILSRVMYGARVSLFVGVVAILLMNLLGVSVGVTTGYLGGWLDAVLMRVVDVLLAFPYIILAIAIMAVLGQGVLNAVIAIGIVNTPTMARVMRGIALTLKERQFVEAARALGAGPVRVLRRHVLPNAVPQIIVFSALSLGETILYIAALGFLGLGISPPTPEWGAMVSTGKDVLVLGRWWPSAFPGAMIMLATLGFVLLGDGLRDVLDPRMRT
ncbi:MAG TPA: ABC transporter permease [bacterium]|nr:ABC transporter permease [bacterium]